MKNPSIKDTYVIYEKQQIKVFEDKINKSIKIIRDKKLEATFKLSMKTLMLIANYLTKNSSEGKTQLALDTKLNYAILAKHIVWMEKKDLATLLMMDNKISIALTTKGREFASVISKIT
jgi:predicted transcriptional regulator